MTVRFNAKGATATPTGATNLVTAGVGAADDTLTSITQLVSVIVAQANTFTVAPQQITIDADNHTGLIIKGHSATQSSPWIQIQNSAANSELSFDDVGTGSVKAGRIVFGSESTAPVLVRSSSSSLQISTASDSSFASLSLSNLTANGFIVIGSGGPVALSTGGVVQLLNNGQSAYAITAVASLQVFGASNTSLDTALVRIAAGVLGPQDGSGNARWFQNSAGRGRVGAAVTNATATMAEITSSGNHDLSLNLIAGRKYTGGMVIFGKNSTGAEGLQFDFNGGTATMTSVIFGFSSTPVGATLGTAVSTAIGTPVTATVVSTSDAVYTIEISLVCNAAGTFIPRFAEVSHATGTATVELGSYLWLEDSTN